LPIAASPRGERGVTSGVGRGATAASEGKDLTTAAMAGLALMVIDPRLGRVR
jgi:hypothetical protein